jgi:hypothetical protein
MGKYIDKDAVVAEINRVLNSYDPNEITSGRYALASLRDFLDTLEVKEADLEKEIDKWWWGKTWQSYGMMLNPQNVRDFAKHFFELGIKAQKGE